MPRASKRRTAPTQVVEGSSKRRRTTLKPDPRDVIIIDSDVEQSDDELRDIISQIEAQEQVIKKSVRTQDKPVASSSKIAPIDLEGDAEFARRLAQEWASEDNNRGASSDVEIIEGPSTVVNISRSNVSEYSQRLSAGPNLKSPSPHFNRSKNYQQSPTKPDEALEPFKDLFTKTRRCSKCSKSVESPRGCVMLSESLMPLSMTQLLHAPCSSCRTNHCRGCFTPIVCPVTCKGPGRNAKCPVLKCCAEGRAIAIFEVLGGFDRQYNVERTASESRALAIAKNQSKRTKKSVGPGGTGYGIDDGAYGYYGGGPKEKSNSRQKDAAQKWDKILLSALNTLTELLPAPYADDPQVYDMLPQASIGHLINLSQIPTLLATLLRNDSVTDWISRKEIYNAMLSLLRRMADCELTVPCLIGERWEVASTCGLENWVWGNGEITLENSKTPPLYAFFKKLTKQSEAFMAGAAQMVGMGDADAEVDEMMIQGTSLSGDIVAARDDLERAIAVLGKSEHAERENRMEGAEGRPSDLQQLKANSSIGKGKGRDVSLDFDKVYAEACERLSFKHVSLGEASVSGDELNYSGYYYAAQLNQTRNSTRVPKDRLHLLKELAVMATSLPPGVWVRVDEVRNDAIKIMIAGPDGTPYSGGLFEFDCFMPIQYPTNPPLMQLKTTGGGSVRFNPNLYNDGKVCLSLLGTWPGRPEEQWSPKSTLLQVLVSIQSMILIDAPYYNEPGHGQANLKAPVSIQYNREISKQTVKWAIVEWLNEDHRNGIWRDVIASHFSIRKEKIRSQIVEWSKSDSSIRRYQTSHVYYRGPTRGRTTWEATPQNDIDLLAEFDKGIKKIESWCKEQNGE
ncbi:Baculoviral IAP repeat-containing protein 6 [Psilocybe cubensis]|uniref:Baculoviral IAP repeat-containing protein 6 n=2 Tax=Psilocybe cubensis TaxID=181762 RepID=A0ACB8HGR7_PSICU|nr:Baculoviral IAP repeat-containing protein 6 [Psilocybe cubensis]KAH9486335.1 Baculoviral IAP repeat-containing protein 6 [Psilocybe cubensis]